MSSTYMMNPLIVPNDQMTEHPMSRVLCSSLLGNMCTTMELKRERYVRQTAMRREKGQAYNPEGTVSAAKIPCNARRAKNALRSCTVAEPKGRMSIPRLTHRRCFESTKDSPKLFPNVNPVIPTKPPRNDHCAGNTSHSRPPNGIHAANAIAYELMIQIAFPPSARFISRAISSVETKRQEVPRVSVAMAMVTTMNRRFFRSRVSEAKPSALVREERPSDASGNGRLFSVPVDVLEALSFPHG